jgi:hypothetical protein
MTLSVKGVLVGVGIVLFTMWLVNRVPFLKQVTA